MEQVSTNKSATQETETTTDRSEEEASTMPQSISDDRKNEFSFCQIIRYLVQQNCSLLYCMTQKTDRFNTHYILENPK